MSTQAENFTDHFPDTPPPQVTVKKRKVQTPYKPRISTVVKNCLEDSVKETRQTQELLGELVDWLEAELKYREELRTRASQLAPLDHRMQALSEEVTESLLRIGRVVPIVARMALSITQLDRNLTETLERAKEAVAPPRERLAQGDGSARQKQS